MSRSGDEGASCGQFSIYIGGLGLYVSIHVKEWTLRTLKRRVILSGVYNKDVP